ncbi:MAG TPA: septum formation initiator family protein [Bellilinea sp.]|nr:septum formation initiator family protein [Bellilinea sp.]
MKLIKFGFKQILIIVGFIIFFFLLMDLNNRINDLTRLNRELAVMQTDVAKNQATAYALEDQLKYANSEAAVAEYARSNGLIKDGEVLVVPIGNAIPKPTEIPEAVPLSDSVTNSKVWWTLFFGE